MVTISFGAPIGGMCVMMGQAKLPQFKGRRGAVQYGAMQTTVPVNAITDARTIGGHCVHMEQGRQHIIIKLPPITITITANYHYMVIRIFWELFLFLS